MLAKAKKSKRRSAASSTSRWPPDPVFFLDKCLGNFDVAQALKDAGARVEIHTDHFAPDAADHDWLLAVGERGWVVLSKDRRLHSNHLQLHALLRGGVKAFVLKSADMTGSAMGMAFAAALPAIRRHVQRMEPPFISHVSGTGQVRVFLHGPQIYRRFSDRGP